MNNNAKTEDMLMVGYVKSAKDDIPVLIIGRSGEGKQVEIVNAFKGDAAVELYRYLTGKKDETK